MRINRVWAMPTGDTFDCPPIGEMVKRYLRASKVSIDPFSRNKRWATYTNDLNPETAAEYHMDACDFLAMLLTQEVRADLIIFDPPYSHYQAKEVYQGVGKDYRFDVEAANMGHWSKEKEICYQLLAVGGYFLHFGWHSNGMGKSRDTQIDEILLVAHGRSHNDTICMAEKKLAHQSSLFAETHLTPLALDGGGFCALPSIIHARYVFCYRA
jgi:hypothetical protein